MSDAPHAVLWDMDGTLVDTEPHWIATEFAMAAKYGGRWSHEQALTLVGNDLLESGRVIKEAMGLTQSPAEVVEELLDGVVARVEESVPWRPGAVELLGRLRDAGVPCGLVTMSYARFVAPILQHLPAESFRVVVTGEQVGFGKPHPEPYLTAAAALGLRPEDCLAIEDSNTGAKSAEAAGCSVLVVENHVPVLEGARRVFRDSLEGLALTDLTDLHREAQGSSYHRVMAVALASGGDWGHAGRTPRSTAADRAPWPGPTSSPQRPPAPGVLARSGMAVPGTTRCPR